MTVPKAIVMMEDHDKAYHAWKERGVRNKTLVHIDAHIDFGWLPAMDLSEILTVDGPRALDELLNRKQLWNPLTKAKDKMMHIGNYIYPAMREGMVDKFYWIVPDPTWRSGRGLKALKDQLRSILKVKQYVNKDLETHDDHLYCRIFDKDIFVMPLANLKKIDEPVLLDIDTDFMLTPFVWDDLGPDRTPWLFPEQIREAICRNNINIDTLTIAYSVNGGFTPLKYKYLGDELRMIFEDSTDENISKIIRLKREGTIDSYEKAIELDHKDASSYFNLAMLYLNEKNDPVKAKELYRKAVSLDKTYASAYNNYGIIHLKKNRLKKAEEEYKRSLLLDEDNIHVLNGLGSVALQKKEYARAEKFFNGALARERNNKQAILGKGIAFFKTKRFNEAEGLFLTVAAMLPDEPVVYWYLAKIFEKKGAVQKAIEHYKKAILAGDDGPSAHLALCRSYLKTGLYFRAHEELKRFLDILGKDILARCSI